MHELHYYRGNKMSKYYSEEFKEQAVLKFYNRGDLGIVTIAKELNISHSTLRYWVTKAMKNDSTVKDKSPIRPQDWSLQSRFQALQDSYGLTDERLHAWCREQGIFAHHLTQWKTDFCTQAPESKSDKNNLEFQNLKRSYQRLEKELQRKEKALSEAAALLLLQKKWNAFLEEEDV
jgi:transposase-like protein